LILPASGEKKPKIHLKLKKISQ